MPCILFLETRVVRDEHRGTPRETRYEAGLVYDLPAASCRHWKSRGVAVDAPPAEPLLHVAVGHDERPFLDFSSSDAPPLEGGAAREAGGESLPAGSDPRGAAPVAAETDGAAPGVAVEPARPGRPAKPRR